MSSDSEVYTVMTNLTTKIPVTAQGIHSTPRQVNHEAAIPVRISVVLAGLFGRALLEWRTTGRCVERRRVFGITVRAVCSGAASDDGELHERPKLAATAAAAGDR